MSLEIVGKNLLPANVQSNCGLINVFNGQKATPEQPSDMLAFCTIGVQAYQQYITHHILMQPSPSNTPVRWRKLLTIESFKPTRQKLSWTKREWKLVTKCLQRSLAWCNQTKLPYNSSYKEYSVLPRALADQNGIPHKSSKSTWTDKLESRYKTAAPSIVTNHLPEGWTPQAAIVDAMFLINTRPLRRTNTLVEYTKLLFDCFILEHFSAGASEVHLIFDQSTIRIFIPKDMAHARWDSLKSKGAIGQQEHISFIPKSRTHQFGAIAFLADNANTRLYEQLVSPFCRGDIYSYTLTRH